MCLHVCPQGRREGGREKGGGGREEGGRSEEEEGRREGEVRRRKGGGREGRKRNKMKARMEWCTQFSCHRWHSARHTCMSSFKASFLFLSLPNESVLKPGHGIVEWEGECVLGTHRHMQCRKQGWPADGR